MAKSTISSFLKKNEAIKVAVVAKRETIVDSKQRPRDDGLEVEKLLLIWIKELDGDSISIISENALRIYADHLKETPSTRA